MAVSNSPSISAQALAREFIDATSGKIGTDEQEVYRILKQVYFSKSPGGLVEKAFEGAVEKIALASLDAEAQRRILGLASPKDFVPAILRDEMSGSELARALDFYSGKEETFRAGKTDYFLEGLASTVDLSSTGSKVFLGLGLVAFGALAVASAPVSAIVGGTLVLGTAVYGAGSLLKNGIEIAFADSSRELKENLRDLGNGVGVTAMAAPFVPKGLQGIKAGLGTLLMDASGAPKVGGFAGFINRHLGYLEGDIEKLKVLAKNELSSKEVDLNRRGSANHILGQVAMKNHVGSPEAKRALLELYFQDTSPAAVEEMDQFTALLQEMTPMDQDLTLTYLPRALEMAGKIPVATPKKLQYLQTVFSKANYWDSLVRPPGAAAYDLTRVLETLGAVYRDPKINLSLAERIEIVEGFLEHGNIGTSMGDSYFYRDFALHFRVLARGGKGKGDLLRTLLDFQQKMDMLAGRNERFLQFQRLLKEADRLPQIIVLTQL